MSDLRDEIIFRQVGTSDKWVIQSSYDEGFVAYIKSRVPASARSWDEESETWTFTNDGKRLIALESIAVQKFRHAQRQFTNADGKLVLKNLKTGHEAIQEVLFK